ncbi:hypothetical protein H5U35_00190, partial [Candidatus Aerophobetes bacterium]|nr:hypothetical protein [Candidatus Aerophobetes bacterium]
MVTKSKKGQGYLKEYKINNGIRLRERKFCQIISGEKKAGDLLKGYNFSPLEIKKFEEFIDRFHLEKMLNPDGFDLSPPGRNLFLIAAFEWEGDNLVIHPVKEESYLIKGRYKINYQKFEMLITERKIEKSKIDRILELFRQIDMINRRTTTIYRILECLKEIQLTFFKSADPLDLFPFSQSELARRLKLHPSTVARAISGKSILTPQGEERALEFFFSRSWAK